MAHTYVQPARPGGSLSVSECGAADSRVVTMAEESGERLYQAIKSGDTRLVATIMAEADAAQLEGCWSAGDPPLVLASKVGHNVEMLAALTRLTWHRGDLTGDLEDRLAALQKQYREDSRSKLAADARTATGETALHCVSAHWEAGSLHEALLVLLAAGCDPSVSDNLRRQQPLHLLVRRLGAGKKTCTPQKVSGALISALRLLASRCDVNSLDHRLRTSLHVLAAAHCSDPQPFLVLLRHGADVGIQNDRGETPLLEALECGALSAAELLIKESTLSKQLINNDKTPSKHLVKNDKINGNCRNDIDKNICDDEKIDSNIEIRIAETPDVVIRVGSNEKLSSIPEMEVGNLNNDCSKRRAIVCTSSETSMLADTELVLRTHNLQLGGEHAWLCKSTLYGETALHVAARKDLVTIVSLMLQASQDPALTGARDLNGDTALHLAAGRGHVEVVEMLLACKEVDVNARNRKGLTPLHVAVESGFIHVVKLLLERPQCDVAARTADDRRSSPFDLAQQEYRRRSQPEMSILLLREAERRKLAMR